MRLLPIASNDKYENRFTSEMAHMKVFVMIAMDQDAYI